MEGYETHLFHAHKIRNGEKYPPTILRKAFKSPESLHLDSVSSSNNETKEESEKGEVSEEDSPKKSDVEEKQEASKADMPDENGVQKEGNINNEVENEDPVDNEENPINETTESAKPNYLQSSESEPLMFPHFSE